MDLIDRIERLLLELNPQACLLVTVLLLPIPLHAEGEEELAGLWFSAGGNILEIHENEDGKWGASLVKVTPESEEAGFEVDGVALRAIERSGADVRFDVPNRAETNEGEEVFAPFQGKLSGDGSTIRGEIEIEEEEPFLVLDERGEEQEITSTRIPLIYRRVPVEVPEPELDDVYKLEVEGAESISVLGSHQWPLGRGEPVLQVYVRLINGDAVELTEVTWTISGGDVSTDYFTLSDRKGLARLHFGLLPNGEFGPVSQLRGPPERMLPPGEYKVVAKVPQLDEDLRAEFTLQLDSWPQVVFLDGAGERVVSTLTYDLDLTPLSFRVRLYAHGEDPRVLPGEDFELALISYQLTYQDGRPTREPWGRGLVKMREKEPGVYETPYPIELEPGEKFEELNPIRSDRRLFIPTRSDRFSRSPDHFIEVDIFVEEFSAVHTLFVFGNEKARHEELTRAALLRHRETIGELRASLVGPLSAEEEAYLAKKEGLIQRALAIIEDGTLGQPQRTLLAGQYLDVLAINCHRNSVLAAGDLFNEREEARTPNTVERALSTDCYRPARRPGATLDLAPLTEGARVTLPCEIEEERLALLRSQGLLRAIAERMGTVDEMVDLILGRAVEVSTTLPLVLPHLLKAPFYAVYELVYGETIKGDELTTIDRLLVGLDFASFRLGTTILVKIGKEIRDARHLRRVLRDINPGLPEGAGFQLGLDGYRMGMVREVIDEPGYEELARLLRVPQDPQLRKHQAEVLRRVSSYRLSRKIRNRIRRVDEVFGESARGMDSLLVRDLGSVNHLLKYRQERAFLESRVASGFARQTGQRFREIDGPTEIMIEWTLKDKDGNRFRLDHAHANHQKIEFEGHRYDGTLVIKDLTRQLDQSHRQRVQFYKELVREVKLPDGRREFENYLIKAFELYWDETSTQWIERPLSSWAQQRP